MSKFLFVINRPEHWTFSTPEATVVSARQYLTDPKYAALRGARVINLCRSLAYQTNGYYVSLIAEARGHKPLPRINTIQDVKSASIIRSASGDLDELADRTLAHLTENTFELAVYFGRGVHKHYDQLCRQIFNTFPAPLLRATFRRDDEDGWELRNVSTISVHDVPGEHVPVLRDRADEFVRRDSAPARPKPGARYDLAILWDKTEQNSASNEKAIQRFIRAADKLDIDAEIIDRDDFGRIGEFDALFIRSTTAVNNHTFRFARVAEAEGLVVVDDPASIIRCSNKVYLAELFRHHDIPAPQTEVLHRDNIDAVLERLGLPVVLKQPDSAFSLGVKKAATPDDYRRLASELLDKSDLVIAQRYLPTEFDWRIGILDGRPLYACKYHMARGHWQIYNPAAATASEKLSAKVSGRHETIPVELAPRPVVRAALKAANAIGRGLYGVDVKVAGPDGGKPCVVEVNDNPSIDAGVEDTVLREQLYERVMEYFLKRLEEVSGER
ncbi:MAG: RimK family protein [Puniceicoccales bacterium]|jgi:glutathione synthase/RimK-type ligase-like ATP-grasp enzyme|nr:RimK family protein [Puniceicoccales bacterium]